MNDPAPSRPFRIEWRITHGVTNVIAPDPFAAIEHLRSMLGITANEQIVIVEVVPLDDPTSRPVA